MKNRKRRSKLANRLQRSMYAYGGLREDMQDDYNYTGNTAKGIGTGALQGAASGAAFGPVGAVVGGAIGAIGGAFTAGAENAAARSAYNNAKKMQMERDQEIRNNLLGTFPSQGIEGASFNFRYGGKMKYKVGGMTEPPTDPPKKYIDENFTVGLTSRVLLGKTARDRRHYNQTMQTARNALAAKPGSVITLNGTSEQQNQFKRDLINAGVDERLIQNDLPSRIKKGNFGIQIGKINKTPNPKTSVVDFMNLNNMDSSKEARVLKAQELGIQGYDFSANKNTELLEALQNPVSQSNTEPVISTENNNAIPTTEPNTRVEYKTVFSPTSYDAYRDSGKTLEQHRDSIINLNNNVPNFKYGGKTNNMAKRNGDPPKKLGQYDVRYHKRDNRFLERQFNKARRRDIRESKRLGLDPYNQMIITRQNAMGRNFIRPGAQTLYSQPVYDSYLYDSNRQSDRTSYNEVPFFTTGLGQKKGIYSQEYDSRNIPNFIVGDGTVDFSRLSKMDKRNARRATRQGPTIMAEAPSDLGWRPGINIPSYNAYGGLVKPKYQMGGMMPQQGQMPMQQQGGMEPIASDVQEVQGPPHELGGVQMGPDAEVEGGEVTMAESDGSTAIFSDRLEYEKGVTFADKADELGRKKGKQEEKLDSTSMFVKGNAKRQIEKIDAELDMLFNEQEVMKRQMGIPSPEEQAAMEQQAAMQQQGMQQQGPPMGMEQGMGQGMPMEQGMPMGMEQGGMPVEGMGQQMPQMPVGQMGMYGGKMMGMYGGRMKHMYGGRKFMMGGKKKSMMGGKKYYHGGVAHGPDDPPGNKFTWKDGKFVENEYVSYPGEGKSVLDDYDDPKRTGKGMGKGMGIKGKQAFGAGISMLSDVANLAISAGTPQAPLPNMVQAMPLKTDVDISAQKAAQEAMQSNTAQAIKRNTASSQTARANLIGSKAGMVGQSNTMYEKARNMQNQLINQNRINQQQATFANVGKMDKYDQQKLQRDSTLKSEASAITANIGQKAGLSLAESNQIDADMYEMEILKKQYEANGVWNRNLQKDYEDYLSGKLTSKQLAQRMASANIN